MQLFVRLPCGGLRACQALPDDLVAAVTGLDAATAAEGALRVVCGGRTLHPRSSLAAAQVAPGATLELLPRVRGGGGDGGSTGAESRSSYLEMYAGKKADKVNPEEERLARWTMCQLSGMPLHPPCVADELGSLFNKEAVLQALLTKSLPQQLAHIGGLKHLIELKLGDGSTAGTAAVAGDGKKGDGGKDAVAEVAARFACPITGQAFNGKYRFVILRKSGHVLSERALKEVPKVVEELVGGKWDPADLLPVCPIGEELQEMREQLLLKRTAERAAKKGKKKEKAAAAAAANGGEHGEAAAAGGKRAADNGSAKASGGGGAAAAATNGGGSAYVAAETAGKRESAAKRFRTSELKPEGADGKIWSSLFTSSQQPQALLPNGKKSNTDYMVRGTTRYI